jgi:hypothetical protein
MMKILSRCLTPAAILLFCFPSLLLADVALKVDWPSVLSSSDLVWNRPPENWSSGAFMGDGLLGANVFLDKSKSSLLWRIGRTDVVVRGNRIPIGELVLKTAGKLQGGNFRLDLWNAELHGTIQTTSGNIEIRSFTHADQMVQVIQIRPDTGESSCHFEWVPGLAVDPRKIHNKLPIPEEEKLPAPHVIESGKIHISIQPLAASAAHETAWTEVSGSEGWRTTFVTVGYANEEPKAQSQAIDAVNTAESTGVASLVASHRDWWHKYWPESFVSIPDNRLQAFYWIQMYKLASATRSDRPAIDLMGPWFNDTPWPKIWWNLNIQLTYWPVLTSNRLELGESLCRMIDNGKDALAANAGKFSDDSYALGRSCSYDLVRPVGHELCDLPWALHNYYLQYRYTMDDAMMRDRLYPLLRGSINYYLHLIKTGSDGYLHITDGYSPEYPNQPAPNPDCNIDLALVRWGCQTLLDTCAQFKINDPLIPRWKETLEKLVPYPTDENGFMISASMPLAESHRHYSHLLMAYPLHLLNPDDPRNPQDRELISKSLNYWMGMSKALRGFSYSGGASIAALLGDGDTANQYLNKLLDTKILPNSMYVEAGPVIETPLSAAASIHDMLLTGWGNKIRVFPAIPKSWSDVSFHDLRTEGAFLISAVRSSGKTELIQVQSLAGQPCTVVTDMLNPTSTKPIHNIADNTYLLDLSKGETAVITPNGEKVSMHIAPVTGSGPTNFYGLH